MTRKRYILLFGFVTFLVLYTACSTSENFNTETADTQEIQEASTEADKNSDEEAELTPQHETTPRGEVTMEPQDSDYRIVTLLPRDAIPAIDDPVFLTAKEADQVYGVDELVIGVEFNGDARAYSIPLLSRHEIVNDTVGGVKIAVTW